MFEFSVQWKENPDFDVFTPYMKHRRAKPKTNLHLLNPRVLWTLWDFLQTHTSVRIRPNPPSSGFLGKPNKQEIGAKIWLQVLFRSLASSLLQSRLLPLVPKSTVRPYTIRLLVEKRHCCDWFLKKFNFFNHLGEMQSRRFVDVEGNVTSVCL